MFSLPSFGDYEANVIGFFGGWGWFFPYEGMFIVVKVMNISMIII